MKRLSVAAIVVAVLSLGVSGWALWRSYDTEPSTPTPAATTPGSSTTVPLVVVPSEVGKNALSATAELEDVNLAVTIVEAPSVTLAVGRVISQRPLQGTEVPVGTVIELTISSGPP